MVVIKPAICENNENIENFKSCAEVLKNLYNLRFEVQFAISRQNDTQKLIDNLNSWNSASTNSSKWRKIVRLMDISKSLQKAQKELLENIEISDSISYEDAYRILSRKDIFDSISKKVKKDLIGNQQPTPEIIASLIAYDTPKIILKQLDSENPQFKTQKEFLEESQKSIFSRFLPDWFTKKLPNPPDFIVSKGPLAGPFAGPPQSTLSVLPKNGTVKFGTVTKAVTEDSRKDSIKAKIIEKLLRRLRKTHRKSISVTDAINDNKANLVRLSQQNPTTPKEQLEIATTEFNKIKDILSPNGIDVIGNTLVLRGRGPLEEKLASKVLTNRDDIQKELIASTLNNFNKYATDVKTSNKIYNDEIEKLRVQYLTIKKSCEETLMHLEKEKDVYKYIQDKNIDQVSQMTLKELPMWKKIFGDNTVVNLVRYSNMMVEYLTLINEIIRGDPTQDDQEILSMLSLDMDKFDSNEYITKSKEQIAKYIASLEKYKRSWREYQTNVEKTLVDLNSPDPNIVLKGIIQINTLLEESRPPIAYGVKDTTSKTSQNIRKYAEAIKIAEDGIAKLRGQPQTERVKADIAKLEEIRESIRNKVKGKVPNTTTFGRSTSSRKNKRSKKRNARSKKKIRHSRHSRRSRRLSKKATGPNGNL